MILDFGTELELPVCNNMPAFYDCSDDPDWYTVCPNDGWEKHMAEVSVEYSISGYHIDLI